MAIAWNKSGVVPVEVLHLVVILDIELADGPAGGSLGESADPGPELAGHEVFGAARAAKLPVGLFQAGKAPELLQFADRGHLWMGVEHEVEQRRAAMAQARDEDDLHHAPLPPKSEPAVLIELLALPFSSFS